MRKILFIFTLIIFSGIACAAQTEAVVIKNNSPIRLEPSATGKLVTELWKGRKLWLVKDEHKNGWYLVALSKDLQGQVWIHGNNIKITKKKEINTDFDKSSKTFLEPNRNEKGETFEQFQARVKKTFFGSWIWYSTDVNDCLHFFNSERLEVNSQTATVWTRQVCFRSADVMSNVPELNKSLVKLNVFYSLNKNVFNCPRAQRSILFSNFYDQDDKQIGSLDLNGSAITGEIPPDSSLETLYKLVCKK